MDFRDYRGIQGQARAALGDAKQNPRRLAALYAGVSGLLLLAVALVNLFLEGQIAGTGGLGGIGLRSVLSAVHTMLRFGVSAVLPFWTWGFLSAVFQIARRQTVGPKTLLDGFRLFGPVLRLTVLKDGFFLLLALVCAYPAMGIFMLTPLSEPMMELLLPVLTETADMTQVLSDTTRIAAMERAMIPMLAIYAVLYLVAAVPFFYRMRMAEFALLDAPAEGAMAALRKSMRLTRGRVRSLIGLDLRFFWYYLGVVGIGVLAYGDRLLPLLPVSLGGQTAFLVCYILHLVCQFAFTCLAEIRVQTVYAVYYNTLCSAPRPPSAGKGQMPWNL